MVAVMENNWIKVCQVLHPQEVTSSAEKSVLEKIEKNIYHKRAQSLRPIIFSMVS